MKNVVVGLLLAGLLVTSSAPLGHAQGSGATAAKPNADQELTATVNAVKGEADFLSPGGDEQKDWAALTQGQVLKAGTKIFVYNKSQVTVMFGLSQKDVIVIQQNTQITIDQHYYDKNKDAVVTDLRLTTGNVAADVNEAAANTDMQIATPNATASVTGTEIENIGTAAGFGDEYSLIEGSLNVQNGAGDETDVEGGETATGDSEALQDALETAIEENFTDVLPEGLTDEEMDAAMDLLGGNSLNPSDINGDNNAFNQNLTNTQGGDATGEFGDGGVNFPEPPPAGVNRD